MASPLGLVGADLLPLVEGEQGHADGIVLGQGLADHLAGLIVHLLLQDQGLASWQMFFIGSFIVISPFSQNIIPEYFRPPRS